MRRVSRITRPHSRRRVTVAALVILGTLPIVLAASPLRIRTVRMESDPQAAPPGIVTLEVAPPLDGDSPDTVRLEAMLHGPLPQESGGDLYALNAIVTFPPTHLEFIAGTLRKGDLFGRDGRDVLITGRVIPERDGALSIGSSRLGPVPGVSAPPGRTRLFSAAFRVRQGGSIPIGWSEATFIDSRVRGVAAARFVGGVLNVEIEPSAPPPQGK